MDKGRMKKVNEKRLGDQCLSVNDTFSLWSDFMLNNKCCVKHVGLVFLKFICFGYSGIVSVPIIFN